MSTPSSPSASAPQTPAIRSFQMDGSSQGNLSSSVNLFRGDVNLTQNLFTLPGRSQGNGLDVSLTVQYQSNVFRQATTWNAEAPTGVLGLGWDLPLTRIEAGDGGSPVPDQRGYTLYDNGAPNRLFQQPVRAPLFALDPGLAALLRDGEVVPAPVRDAFRAHGLSLSATALVEGVGPWTLADEAEQQLYALDLVDGRLSARDGGELYQLQNYQFWKVLYYPRYERWVVVSDEAVRRSFGGRTSDAPDGSATGRGDSIAWSVWWTDGGTEPAWTGASAAIEGQVQVARAWYLVEVADRFGSATSCAYQQVTQRVGDGGKPSTKAVYLSTLVDVFGRTVTFRYGDKLWSADPTAPREYHDPHRDVPSDAPGPYQDRYETRYLARVDVTDPRGAAMFSVRFDYAPRPELVGPERAVANVTSDVGALEGDTYKRFLTSVVQLDQDGVPSPGLLLGYDLADDTEGGQPGALLSVTYPQGGQARYTYVEHDLTLCERTLAIDRPPGVPQGATPRVFFGDDYVVSCFYQQSSLELSLRVLTWTGVWLAWQLDPASAVIDTEGIDLSTLQVLAQADFLAVTFRRTRGDREVYLFERDTARPGQWRPATLDGTTTAPDDPTLSYPASGDDVTFAGGDTFFVVGRMSHSSFSGTYDLITWRWSTRRWERRTVACDTYTWITAAASWYALLDDKGALTVNHLDGLLEWRAASPAKVTGLVTTDPTAVQLVPGAALVVVANLQSSNSQQNTTRLWIAEWDAEVAVTVTGLDPFTDWFGSGNAPLGWTPQVLGDTLVGLQGNLVRRDGVGWSVNRDLSPGENPPASTAQRYAYGTDCAIRVLAPTTGVGAATAVVMSFDPTLAAPWVGPTAIGQSLPAQSTARANWPSVGVDWLVIGPFAWARGSATDWGAVVAGPATLDLTTLAGGVGSGVYDSESLVDETPGFVAYTVDAGSAQSVQALVIRNGGADGAPVPFGDEKLYTASGGGVAGAGLSPRGPRSFVTFPSKYADLDQAQTVIVHRYAGGAVAGPITHYTVSVVQMDDGFGDSIPTAFSPDLSSAGADASGDIVKFYQNTVYPGTDDPSDPRDGWVVSRYLNGAEDLTEGNDYDMLDGMLVHTETWLADGSAKLESTETDYTVVTRVGSSPTDPDAPEIWLRGGWVTQTEVRQLTDGVTTTTTTSYVTPGLSLPYGGQPVVESRSNVDGGGAEERFSRVSRYGVEHYSELVAIHALADVAQVSTRRFGGGIEVVVGANATTFRTWPSEVGEGVLTPAPDAGFGMATTSDPDFPFAGYRPGDAPAGWQLSARTTARGPYGQETANVDPLGNATTTLFDTAWEMAVARIANATPAGCAYLGFQAYEDTSAWRLEGVRYDEDDAFTGTRSIVLPGGSGASVAVSVAPSRAETWLVGCRYRTPTGFVADGSGLSASVSVDGDEPRVVTLPWGATDDRWLYVTLPVPLTSAAATRSIVVSVRADNGTGDDVHLDAVLVAPLINGATLRTFDPDSQQVLSTMDAGGRTSRTAYDRNYRAAVSIGAFGQVREISTSFLSRQGSAADRFDRASPNAELTLHSPGGGTLETFRDGGLWSERWVPDDPADWRVADGALLSTGASPATLRWASTPADTTWAVYLELQPGADGVLAMSAGDLELGYAAGGWWARSRGVDWTPLARPPAVARRWLLVAGEGVVLFFGDGQLLFSERVSLGEGPACLTASGGPLALRNLTGARAVRLGVSYNDATGRQRQIHQLHGADSLLCELVFDSLDRQVAVTRSAPGSFGSGGDAPTMTYRPGFLDVRAFLAATATTWAMAGDVAEYYAGQTEGGVRRPDDEGYPYWGTRYEASPRSVKVETSQPGKAQAIDRTVPASERATVQYAYGANDGVTPALPAGQFAVTEVTSPVKTVSSSLADKLGQQVGTLYAALDGAIVNQSAGERAYLAPVTGPTASLAQQLPNALIPGPQSGDASFVRTTRANALQDTESIVEPDAGETRFLLDAVGNLRFVQPALEPGEAWFVYYRYDAIGRMVEEGTVSGTWDPVALRVRAEDPSWPSASEPGVRTAVALAYDGPGDDPTLVGLKWRAVTTNPDPEPLEGEGAVDVVETFGYDRAGNLVSVTQAVTGAVEARGTLRYAYDAISEVIRLDLPEGGPLAALHYTYDDQGDIAKVGTTPGGAELGAFTYTPDRQPRTQVTGAWTRVIEYTSPGWIASLVTTAGDQSHAIRMDYEADGAMLGRSVTASFTDHQGTYADLFGYDDQRRLASADGSSGVRYDSYDANGNLWALTQRGEPSTFQCKAGANQLATVTLGGVATSSPSYDAAGRMVSGLGRELAYDRATGMTTAVVADGARLRLAYGSGQQRVVKKDLASGASRVYFDGAGQVPVATLIDGEWAIAVYGPTGLLAWVTSDGTRLPFADATGSVWAVVAGDALLEVRSYLPFGVQTNVWGDPGAVPQGFQGQEVDAEVGLSNFRTRMYDPTSCRFLTPDPQRQFASPYVFAGNNPLTVTDPTGEISLWAQVGIAAAMVVVTAVGIGLTLFTGGASDAAAAGVDAALAGTAGAVEAGAAAGAEGAAAGAAVGAEAGAAAGAEVGAAAAEGAVAAGAEGTAAAGASASAEVAAGAGTAEATASSFSWTTYGVNTLGYTLSSAGQSGLSYDLQHGRDFTAKGFFESVGIGAASGFVSGGLAGALNPVADGLTSGFSGASGVLARAGGRAVAGALRGAISSDVKTVLTNVSQHQPWYQGLLKSTASGAASSAATGAAGSLGKSAWAGREAIAAKAASKGIISDQTVQRIVTLPEIAKAAATSDAAIGAYVVAGFFVPAGYIVWGAAQS